MRGTVTNYTVQPDAAEQVVPHQLQKKKALLLSIGSSISHRLTILKARLVLLLVICAAIMITALLTWKFSIEATEHSCNNVSAQLRRDVTQGAMEELKGLLVRASVAGYGLYRALNSLGVEFTREAFSSVLLPLMWGTFSTNPDFAGVGIGTREDVQGGYRRDGPETPILGDREAVGVPSPANDTLHTLFGYIPDPITGRPLLDGPMVKMCTIGSCPAVMDPAVYIPPSIAPTKGSWWPLGAASPAHSIKMSMSITSNLEPNLSVLMSFKDSKGDQRAYLSISSTSTGLRTFLQSTSLVRHFNGRIFIVEGASMRILSATSGPLYTPPVAPGARPTFLSAVNSSDDVIRETARYVNTTYGSQMFTQPIQSRAWLSGHGVYYITTTPLDYEGLQLVVILAVPRVEFSGRIEESRRQGLIFTMVIVIVMFVLGGLAMCISTIGVSKKLETQEKDLDVASAANKALREQLLVMTQVYADDWAQVDMGTPLEKLTAIIKRLRPGRFLSHAQVQQMQALVTADDLHKPQFLATINSKEADGNGQGGRRLQVDSETGNWIELLAVGRRPATDRHESPRPSPRSVSSTSSSVYRRSWRKEPVTMDAAGQRLRPHGSGAASPLGQMSLHNIQLSGWWDQAPLSAAVMGGSCSGDENLSFGENGSESNKKAGDSCQRANSFTSLHAESVRPGSARFVHLLHHTMGPMEAHTLQMMRRVAMLSLPTAQAVSGSGVLGGLPAHGSISQPQKSAGTLVAQRPMKWESNMRVSTVAETVTEQPTETGGLAHLLVPLNPEQQQQVGFLRAIGEWEFDTLAMEAVTGEGILPLVGYTLFLREGLILEFGIDEHKLANFLLQIARGMEPHPYHNTAHITDVSASFFHILNQSGMGDYLRPIDKLAALCAALIHDFKHPGVNNDFLQRTREELATVYNDQSPLENYHLAEAFQLLYSNEHCNFLDVLSEEDFMEVRRIVIEMVLASDLKRHFVALDVFKARMSQELPWDPERDSDRILLLQLALKVADIGHTAKPLKVHQEWTQRACEEFYRQGDMERELSLRMSPFMDRHNNNVPRSQVRFFQFVAKPLVDAWVKVSGRSMTDYLPLRSTFPYACSRVWAPHFLCMQTMPIPTP
eukprot:jgi/Mesvir1/13978/Mv25581-RA.8